MSLLETTASAWPFPPATGPVPWTPDQLRAYKHQQREQVEEAPW